MRGKEWMRTIKKGGLSESKEIVKKAERAGNQY